MASYPLDFSDRSSSSSNNNGGTCGGTAAASSSSSRTSTLTSKMTWEGYEEDLLQAFEEFYRLGDFVDVTLICDDLTLRAHRIVLAACSHFFDRILRDSNCKHPVILLNGFEGWEIEACIEFMYRGWIQVPFDKVNELVTTAGVLEIRGLADYVTKLEEMTMGMRMPLPVGMTTGNNRVTSPTLTRDSSVIMTEDPMPLQILEPNMAFEFDNNPRSPKCLNLSMGSHLNEKPQTTAAAGGGGGGTGGCSGSSSSSNSGTNPVATSCTTTTSISLPGPIVLRQSPLRRKQARPRRRSGDYVAQDLRKMEGPDEDQVIDYRVTNSNNSATTTVTMSSCSSGSTRSNSSPSPAKSSGSSSGSHIQIHQQQQQHHHSHHLDHPLVVPPLPSVPPPPPPPLPPPPLLLHHLPHHIHNHHHQHLHHDLPPIIRHPSPSNNNNNNNNVNNNNNNNNNSDDGISSSNCVISPPNSPPFYFPKASPPSPEERSHACSTPPIFPPFTNGFGQPSHWPGLPLGPAPIFGRHRAQHSAPRGGPPRAWSNADLTEALHNVWNKKMTTSQASRIFGIPYNSLLMYVRGKYGKSLKLDLLKKGLDMALENKNNNKSKSPETNPPEFSPFPPGIFGEYPPPFPFATALSHILPPPVIEPKIELGKTEDLK